MLIYKNLLVEIMLVSNVKLSPQNLVKYWEDNEKLLYNNTLSTQSAETWK